MLTTKDIRDLYHVVRKYKSHDIAKKIVVKHYFFKVRDHLTLEEFKAKVNQVVDKYA